MSHTFRTSDSFHRPDYFHICSPSFQFTAKQEACRGHLARLVSSELHAATVARIIGVMVRTHTGLDDSTTLRNMNATGTSLWDKDKVQTLFLIDIVKDVEQKLELRKCCLSNMGL